MGCIFSSKSKTSKITPEPKPEVEKYINENSFQIRD